MIYKQCTLWFLYQAVIVQHYGKLLGEHLLSKKNLTDFTDVVFYVLVHVLITMN